MADPRERTHRSLVRPSRHFHHVHRSRSPRPNRCRRRCHHRRRSRRPRRSCLCVPRPALRISRSPLLVGLVTGAPQVLEEPVPSQVGDVFECAGFFEEVCCAGNDLESGLSGELFHGLAVELDDYFVKAADDQQCRLANVAEIGAGEVRPTTTRAAAAPVLAPKSPTGRRAVSS